MFDNESTLAAKAIADFRRTQSLRRTLGIALIVAGVVVAVGILIQAKQLISGPDDPYLLHKLASIDASEMSVTWSNGNGKVTLPPNVLMIIGYVVAVFILM